MKNIKKRAVVQKNTQQGWEGVATWYDQYLAGEDTYQAKVITPNLVRLLDIKKGERLIDLACGQGFFSELFARAGATVTGVDISESLIAQARDRVQEQSQVQMQAQVVASKNTNKNKNTTDTKADTATIQNVTYHVASADTTGLISESYDAGIIVLALENIAQTQVVLHELARLLTSQGRAVIVLLHPAFRIPQHADWQYGAKKDVQQRVLDCYLSERSIRIDTHPHQHQNVQQKMQQKNSSVKNHSMAAHSARDNATAATITYHRSLQWYSKALRSAGFTISTIEEWISHKTSQAGPHQKIEDVARKEFPLFMALEVVKK